MKVGFCLGGGGGKGGFSAGITYALWRNGIKPDVVSSISVGALNGILIATGQYEQMKDTWHTVVDDDVRKEHGPIKYGWRLIKHFLGVGKPILGYWSSDPLQSLVRIMLIGKHTVCDYYCGAVEIESNSFTYFHIPKGTTFTEANVDRYINMIVSSTAIPAVFEPIEIDGRLYTDGGVHHQMPLAPLASDLDANIDYIVGVSHKHRGYSGQTIRNDVDMIEWTLGALLDKTSDYEFERFEMINALCRAGMTEWAGKKRKYYPSTIFRPTQSLSDGRRFHHTFSKIDFEHGQKMAEGFTIE